jgi:hypothetical protein
MKADFHLRSLLSRPDKREGITIRASRSPMLNGDPMVNSSLWRWAMRE